MRTPNQLARPTRRARPWLAATIGLVLIAGCDSDAKDASVDSGQLATDAGSADQPTSVQPFADECTQDFGTPVELSQSLSGQQVILEGRLDRFGNPSKAGSVECGHGMGALVLWTKEVDDQSGMVRITTTAGGHIFCGCDDLEDEECKQYRGGAHVRIDGTLQYFAAGTNDELCVQGACFGLTPQDRCVIDGCDQDGHCDGVSCNEQALQCRSLPAASCHPLVGCESAGGVTHYCAGSGPAATCQPPGDGSEGAVCADSAACTCDDCVCVDHLCEWLPPLIP